MKNPFFLLLSFILLSFTSSYCQTTRHHGVFWGRLILSDKISVKSSWDLYLQKRTQNIPGEKNIFGASHFTSVWLWLNYSITKNLKLSVSPFGYFDSWAFLTKPSDVDIPGIKEFRWVVRLEQQQAYKIFNFSNRYSVEYRERNFLNNGVYLPNWRIRYQARVEKPVTGIVGKDKPVTFFVADEIFVQFGKAVRNNPNVFDQNRMLAGFSFDPLKNIRTTFSYLNIIQERNNGQDYDDAHAFWVILTFNNLFSQFKKHQ